MKRLTKCFQDKPPYIAIFSGNRNEDHFERKYSFALPRVDWPAIHTPIPGKSPLCCAHVDWSYAGHRRGATASITCLETTLCRHRKAFPANTKVSYWGEGNAQYMFGIWRQRNIYAQPRAYGRFKDSVFHKETIFVLMDRSELCAVQ